MNITYRIDGNYVTFEDLDHPYYHPRYEIYWQPEIGQKYNVVFFCDYDNTEYGDNYTIEVTADNLAEITYHMNDLENDITQYILIEQ